MATVHSADRTCEDANFMSGAYRECPVPSCWTARRTNYCRRLVGSSRHESCRRRTPTASVAHLRVGIQPVDGTGTSSQTRGRKIDGYRPQRRPHLGGREFHERSVPRVSGSILVDGASHELLSATRGIIAP